MFILVLSYVIHDANACRFTVREIGFSTLSQDVYTVLVVDENIQIENTLWQNRQNNLKESNIRLKLLDRKNAADQSLIKQLGGETLTYPTFGLLAPDGRILNLGNGLYNDVIKEVLDSPVRKQIRETSFERFAFVVWINGVNEHQNKEVRDIILDNSNRITNIMPHMPKEVRIGPKVIELDRNAMEEEKVLMWSLGLTELPQEPVAFVLYGRGRIMGGAVAKNGIVENQLYKLMSMIGADCECGLDRKWMLGSQVPLLWTVNTQQTLHNEVGFDVDNPMILAEMSRILAKEINPEMAGEIGYGPEVVKLNEAFNQIPEIKHEIKVEDDNTLNVWWYVSGVIVLIISAGIIVFFKNRTN